jgi:O-antigen ligase
MKRLSAPAAFALLFGLFLGLCVWKFGNPVILDRQIATPVGPAELLQEPWPIHWAGWLLLPLAVLGLAWPAARTGRWPHPGWLWLLPLAWLGWQFFSATNTVDATLTKATLWQFSGCVACYFLGLRVLARDNAWRWLLPGLFAALTFCLMRAVNQHVYEYPQNYQTLVEGSQNGWTNFTAAALADMRTNSILIISNGLELPNPVILKKFAHGRACGTLVYPNALAELILLLLPLAFTLALTATKSLKPAIRLAVIGLTAGLGGAAFFWTGSKLGWLIALGVVGLYLLRREWPQRLKLIAVAAVLVLGLGVFAVRFHSYLSAGATSVGARFDYWRAAVQTTAAAPVLGTGPGTFQRPYARLKSPDSEMARLTHNDYLEQFCDAGIPSGLAYTGWIALALATVGKKFWRTGEAAGFAVFAGLLAWFTQNFGEFGLYIPALAWTAFTLLGCAVAWADSEPADVGHHPKRGFPSA